MEPYERAVLSPVRPSGATLAMNVLQHSSAQQKADTYCAAVAALCPAHAGDGAVLQHVGSQGTLCSRLLQQDCDTVVHHKFRCGFVFVRAFLRPWPGYVSYILNLIINCALLSVLTNPSWSSLSKAICICSGTFQAEEFLPSGTGLG